VISAFCDSLHIKCFDLADPYSKKNVKKSRPKARLPSALLSGYDTENCQFVTQGDEYKPLTHCKGKKTDLKPPYPPVFEEFLNMARKLHNQNRSGG